jgi:hypothetical protein
MDTNGFAGVEPLNGSSVNRKRTADGTDAPDGTQIARSALECGDRAPLFLVCKTA